MDFMPKVSAWARLPNQVGLVVIISISKVGKTKKIAPFLCTWGYRAKDTEGIQCIGPRMGLSDSDSDSMPC